MPRLELRIACQKPAVKRCRILFQIFLVREQLKVGDRVEVLLVHALNDSLWIELRQRLFGREHSG